MGEVVAGGFPPGRARWRAGQFPPGTLIAGYRIQDQVGTGGMGSVFRARDEDLGRLVALKVLSPALGRDPEFRERFIGESRAAAAVDHPNIIPVHAAGEDHGVLYLAMRYVAGGDLHEVLQRDGPLSPARVPGLLSPVASALDAAHSAGIVHRDVKARNVLVDTSPGRPDHPYLSDFGASKLPSAPDITGAGQFIGTPDCAAPEQLAGLPAGPRSDQYALACVAFTVLTGSLPFRRDSWHETLAARMSGPLPWATDIRPDLPPAVSDVICRALARDPASRYGSCSEFAAELSLALQPAGAARLHHPVAAAGLTALPGRTAGRAAAGESATLTMPVPAAGRPAGPRRGPRSRRRGCGTALAAAAIVAVAVAAAAAAALLASAHVLGGGHPAQHAASRPLRSYSSATDAHAAFHWTAGRFTISGGGADLFTGSDAYSTIFRPRAVSKDATIVTRVNPGQSVSGSGKAGILVRNDMTAAGRSPEGVDLYESPQGGIQFEWDSDGGRYISKATPANGADPELLPVWLELVRRGARYTGYFSFDGTGWLRAGTAVVPRQAAAQDAGLFVTSHTAGTAAQATFTGFTVTAHARAPSAAIADQTASPGNTLSGGTGLQPCGGCYGGQRSLDVGFGATLTFNVTVPAARTYRVTLVYCDGTPGPTGRQAGVSADGGTQQLLTFTPTGSFTTIGARTIRLHLTAGPNTITIANPSAFTPDFNEIVIG